MLIILAQNYNCKVLNISKYLSQLLIVKILIIYIQIYGGLLWAEN